MLFDGIVLQDEATVVEGGKAAEYRINWGCDDYVNVGEVWAEIEGVGNYSGTKRVTYTIKGFLDDYNQSPGYTRIEVGDPEIYTTKPLTPKNVKVTFNGKALEEGKDYRFDTESGIDNTDVTLGYGKRASVQIEGMGDYRSDAYVEFDIRPLNLSTDDLEENHYNAKVKESYVYSGYPILAAADITHNGVALTSPENYTLSYYRVAQAEGGEELVEEPSPTDVGKYSIQISGAAPNYEGFCSAGYEITPYQIDEQHKDGSKVEILNVEDVVWDELAAQAEGADASAALEQNAAGAWAVVQKKLQVQYTPYNEMTGELGEPRMLTPDEYEVSYENNTTLGQAGKGILRDRFPRRSAFMAI